MKKRNVSAVDDVRDAIKTRLQQHHSAMRLASRGRLLEANRSEAEPEQYFSLSCIGAAVGLDVEDPDVVAALLAIEDEMLRDSQQQVSTPQVASTCDEEAAADVAAMPPGDAFVDWEEYYRLLTDNTAPSCCANEET